MTGTPDAAEAARIVERRIGDLCPDVAVVLGSGLAPLAGEVEGAVAIPYGDLPGWPAVGVEGHGGELVLGRLEGRAVAVLKGRAHYYEHGRADVMAAPIATLARLGVRTLLLTNAAGSLHSGMGPGRLMLIRDHINWSGLNPLIGASGGVRFVDMTRAYDPGLAAALRRAAETAGIALAEGVYMWFSGPSFETPAEIRMARLLGADAVGMSTVPEVILARAMGLSVAAVSAITNLGAGLSEDALSHEHTQAMAVRARADLIALLRGTLREMS